MSTSFVTVSPPDVISSGDGDQQSVQNDNNSEADGTEGTNFSEVGDGSPVGELPVPGRTQGGVGRR